MLYFATSACLVHGWLLSAKEPSARLFETECRFAEPVLMEIRIKYQVHQTMSFKGGANKMCVEF